VKPLVSILIPAYNAERWIADTIRSALDQSWPRKEIIVVDDGSRDHTLSVARQFAGKEVSVVSQENQGQRQRETKRSSFAREITFNGWMPTICCRRVKSKSNWKRAQICYNQCKSSVLRLWDRAMCSLERTPYA